MNALSGILTARWFLSLLGTLALAALVWFVGPLIGFAGTEPLGPQSRRWWVIGALFVLWALWQIGAALVVRQRNRRLVEQLAGGPGAAPDPADRAAAEELKTLQGRFDAALALLKGSEGRKGLGGHWVYQLPWYLIIGPPGCGKTTALLNSGLRFPLAERLGQGPVGGVGGTRNCDWWFTDQAVLLDTAGRYTTQDSDAQVDSAAWLGFLALLKKHRPRRPINALLLGISLADLLQWSPAERAAHAQAIRARVQELYGTLRLRLPIYVLFMKADLVAGFSEFFADLGKEGREQVWGMTFPFDPAPDAAPGLAAYGAEQRALEQRLDQHLLGRLQAERDRRRRGLVLRFPRQFGALGETVDHFLNDCLDATRFESRPLVRGVYFTSGTQTGTPIDRVLAAIAANFGLGRQGLDAFQGTAKSFFVTRLLREVVFPEAPLAGLDPRLERRRRLLKWGAYAGVALLTVSAAAAWTLSYLGNRAYITAVAGQVSTIQTQIDSLKGVGGATGRDLLAVLPVLNAARQIPGGYADRDAGTPLSMELGLDQVEKLGPQAQRAYQRLLHKTLLPAITLQLEEQVRRALADPARLYEALRLYLMLDDAQHADPAVLQAAIERDWAQRLPRETTTEQRAELARHLSALLAANLSPLPLALDADLIRQAREVLTGTRLAPRIYGQLEGSEAAAGLSDFTLARAGGPLTMKVLARRSGKPINQGIPALYTYDGYHQRFDAAVTALIAAAALESWVLGPQGRIIPGTPQAAALAAEVRDLYLRDYVTRWDALLTDLSLIPPRDLQGAAQSAEVLANPADSPLRRLLIAAARETALDRPPGPAEGGAGGLAAGVAGTAAGALADRAVNSVGGVAGVAAADLRRRVGEQAGAASAPEAAVTRHFAWLQGLVDTAGGNAAPLDKTLETVGQLGLHLSAVDAAATSGRGPLTLGTGKEIQAAKQAAAAQHPVVAGVLGTLAQDSATLVAGGARVQLNNLWTATPLPFCREAIQGRYPVEPGSRRDTTLADFGRLFGPGGLLDAFFKDHLAPLVDSSRRPWRWTNADLGIPTAVLAQFQRAEVIREAFFAGGGKTPAVEFELTPTSLDRLATQFTLDLGGQVLDYRQGPRKPQTLKWPAPEGLGRARITFTGIDGKTPGQTEEGPWAWFRLLDRARLQATAQPELFRLVFTLSGFSASFDLRATSVRNPFDLKELRGFSCPERL
ncbi:type VI secretion system membrane subunit TssM [Candidatus Thiodictyon syntrophicum]|jgi:type VI secretion system protein ImpL|uniref:Type VI secretion protein n=1 Tax=Candidatus Thiodictyon syntrophicum TaxID=1166950 RepID=A0A2K8U7E2_9GAMM|nr:type VI secretion system membrane subunit TssM [Candidatus Thiodictyon syntrophicum]AUB81496.1 type VI secretion protein [Candidatus Thiodictyon syntrophicum]